ncbi:MAG: hypothetical protein V7K14_10500 [Nostoc sp.]|uniref:hypothetical protein n=1 Tax=Nostoc sp. TaxID=1180 RepID=UPI002FF62CF9
MTKQHTGTIKIPQCTATSDRHILVINSNSKGKKQPVAKIICAWQANLQLM